MKPTATLRRFLCIASSALLCISYAHAADVTWDITPGTVGAGDSLITGGTGAWDTTNGNWTTDAGVNNIAWVNANNDTAIFGDVAGTVTLGTGITVGGLTFDTAGYTVAGDTLTFGTAGNITANANATISSILAGAAITKAGTGTLVLSGNNSYTTTTISAGTLQIGAGGTTGTLGSGTVLNDSALSFNRGDHFTVANVISGSGTVTHNGVGNLEIWGNNSYIGGTFINSGLLFLRADLGADLGTGTVTVGSSGGANLLIWAPGAVTLTNNFVLNGATGVDNRAALNHDGGAGLVTLTGTVTLNATSDIGVGGGSFNNMIMSGVVSGVAGAGLIVDERNVGGANYTLTLSGANTYTGPTTLTGGTLKAGVASVANVSGAFGKNSAVTLSNTAGVTLDIAGFATQIGSLTGGGASGGNVILGTAGNARTLTVGGDNTSPAAYAGVISQAGGLTKIGTGTQILSGTNTYTGATDVFGGTLTFAGSSSGTLGAIQVTGAGTTELKIQAGSYTLGGGGFFVGSGFGAGIVSQTGGAVVWNNNGLQLLIGNGTSAGTYNLSGGSVTTLTGVTSRGVMLGVNTGSSGTFNLSGTGTLTVAGTSRLMIGRTDASSPNTTNLFSQSGGTATISNLTIGGPNAAAGSNNNGTLDLSGGTFTATNFLLLSAAAGDVSTINIGGTAVVTLPNLPTARGSGATATMNFDGGTLKNSATGTFITGLNNAFIQDGGATFDTSLNSTTISQNLLTHGSSLGGGLTKTGANTLTLSGTNTYTGGTTVSDGTLTLGSASALGTGAANITGGSLDLGGQTVANTVSIGAAGTLTGSGSTGAATLAGSVTPGGSGSGLITMASASVASTSAIALQLAATGTRGADYDALTISGVLALDGTITVILNGLTPANGQSFDLIDSTGSIDVTNFTVATDLVLPSLGGGLVWDTSAFVSTGVVSIATGGGDPYTTWAGAAVFDQDDNNDGVDNGLAWLLGAGSPTENATGRLPVVTQTGGNLELSFTCLKVAGRGANLLNLQYSKDLGITDLWTSHEVSVPDAAGLVGSVTFTVPTLNGNAALVNLKASIPASEAAPGTKLFGRLMAVKQP